MGEPGGERRQAERHVKRGKLALQLGDRIAIEYRSYEEGRRVINWRRAPRQSEAATPARNPPLNPLRSSVALRAMARLVRLGRGVSQGRTPRQSEAATPAKQGWYRKSIVFAGQGTSEGVWWGRFFEKLRLSSRVHHDLVRFRQGYGATRCCAQLGRSYAGKRSLV